MKNLIYALLGLLLLIPVSLAAQDSTSGTVETEETMLLLDDEEEAAVVPADETLNNNPIISTWDFVKMLLILAVVVGVIYLIFFLLKRGFKKQLPENDLIQVVGSRTLSGNRSIHLVELGKSLFLLGSADGGVSLISEIRDQETLDILKLERSQAKAWAPLRFGKLLQGLLKTPVDRQAGTQELRSPGQEQEIAGTVSYLQQQRERLRKL